MKKEQMLTDTEADRHRKTDRWKKDKNKKGQTEDRSEAETKQMARNWKQSQIQVSWIQIACQIAWRKKCGPASQSRSNVLASVVCSSGNSPILTDKSRINVLDQVVMKHHSTSVNVEAISQSRVNVLL